MKRNAFGENTDEVLAGMGAVIAGVLVGFLALHAGMGLLNAVGAAFLAYVVTIVVAVYKLPLHPGRVVVYSVRGAIVTAVVTGIVLIGIVKAFKGLA